MRGTRTPLILGLFSAILVTGLALGLLILSQGGERQETKAPAISTPTGQRVTAPKPTVQKPRASETATQEPTWQGIPTVLPTLSKTAVQEPIIQEPTTSAPAATETSPPTPSLYSPKYIREQSERFLQEASTELPEGETYQLEELKGPKENWLVLTLSRQNPNWDPGTGTEGLLAIGRLEAGQWHFLLPSEETFDSWLDWLNQLPEGLLPSWLKESFQPIVIGAEETSFSSQNLIWATEREDGQEPVFYLPYPEGAKYKITTLPGEGEHLERWGARYALDFGVCNGCPIAAIAGGRVVELKEDSQLGGCHEKYKDTANFLAIEIAPNQVVRYMHLQYRSVTEAGVSLGQQVEAGQIIGRVGATGWSCGAHLHVVLERHCEGRICGSLPLSFVEFGPADPRHNVYYVSQNKSPEERRRIAEEERQAREQQEIAAIKEAIDKFHIVYQCSTVNTCDEGDVISSWVTQGMFEELFPFFCFTCPEKWDENTLIFEEYLPFQLPQGDRVSVVEKEKWESRKGEERFRAYTVVDHFLVKEAGVWKVDDYEITCGYMVKLLPDGSEGEIVETKNLEGCLWQPPAVIPTSEPSDGST